MANYLMKLKPIGNFFFGSKKGFADKGQWDRSKENTTSLLRSRKFPQQTSLLGMLRMEILKQDKDFCFKNLSDYKKDEWEKMKISIGPKSFDIDSKDQDFGMIKNISPLFIYNNRSDDYFMKIPKDHRIYEDIDKESKFEKYKPFKISGDKVKTNLGNINLVKKDEYDAKDGISNSWVNIKNKKIYRVEENVKKNISDERITKEKKDKVYSENIFIEDQQIGINKNRKVDGLYKQIYYRLKEGFEFAFYLESDFEFKNNIVQLGKEKSTFKLTVKKVNDSFYDLFSKFVENKEDNKIILISDTYISEESEYNNLIDFAICNSIPFKNLKTCKKKITISKTKYNFGERGSVIYAKEGKVKALKELIKSNKNLYKIGYNHFI